MSANVARSWPPEPMNPSVNFPSDTLLPALVEAVKPDIKPAAQIVRDIVRRAEQVIAEMRPE